MSANKGNEFPDIGGFSGFGSDSVAGGSGLLHRFAVDRCAQYANLGYITDQLQLEFNPRYHFRCIRRRLLIKLIWLLPRDQPSAHRSLARVRQARPARYPVRYR